MSLFKKRISKFLLILQLAVIFLPIHDSNLICATANAADIKVVNRSQFIETLDRSEKYYQILFFFTSWCPHCKRLMNEILERPKSSNTDVFFISLDKDYMSLSKMVEKISKDVDFYYVRSANDTIGIFQDLNIRYKNQVPYVVVLNENGRVVDEDLTSGKLQKYLR